MLKKYLLQISLLLTLLMCVSSLTAGVYRWVDENGHVQYGDRAPSDVEESDEVDMPDQESGSAPAKVDRKEARDRLLEQYQREREEKKAAAVKERNEKKKRKVMCDRAKTRLTEYLEHGSLYKRLPNQERKYLTDKERDAEIAKARATVKKWCK